MPHILLKDVLQSHPTVFITENPNQSVIISTHIVCASLKTIPPGVPVLIIPESGNPRVVLYDKSLEDQASVYRVIGGYTDYTID